MARLAFLTPDTLEGVLECSGLDIPAHLFRYVAGALSELTSVRNWELHGSVTPEQAADYFNELLLNTQWGVCPQMDTVLTFRQSGGPGTPQQVASGGTGALVLFGQAEYLNGYDYASGVVTVMQDGLYCISGTVQFAANANGRRDVVTKVNGSNVDVARLTSCANSTPEYVPFKRDIYLQSGDEITFQAIQNSGSTLELHQTNGAPWLTITRFRDDWTIANE